MPDPTVVDRLEKKLPKRTEETCRAAFLAKDGCSEAFLARLLFASALTFTLPVVVNLPLTVATAEET